MEWQFHGDDEWVFGRKVRGMVRWPRAEIYFNEELDSCKGGWIWMAWVGPKRNYRRGVEGKLEFAVEAAERALGIIK